MNLELILYVLGCAVMSDGLVMHKRGIGLFVTIIMIVLWPLFSVATIVSKIYKGIIK